MQAWSVLLAGLAMLSSAAARIDDYPAAHEFAITSLTGKFQASGSAAGSPFDAALQITLNYTMDPAAAEGETVDTICNLGWDKAEGPGPTNWTLCDTPAVQWRLPSEGWSSTHNFHVDVFQTTDYNGAGLYGTHGLIVSPGNRSNPDAYLSCIQMGKYQPDTCTINGALSAHMGSVIMPAEPRAKKPSYQIKSVGMVGLLSEK
ncbi:hypothetical protein F5Y18DRAFT_439816 [Xylariaceae sp. FL1019]|nr:hypothetical protein F5Y18DRAFT_439816 [Xylariaceae sp. FL1019]